MVVKTEIVRGDKVCRQFMTAPGIGPIVAITYKTAVDDPQRIEKSKGAGPLFGLTPKRCQSVETDVIGGISRIGDAMVRAMLYEAANSLFSRTMRFSALKRWGLAVAKRRGMKRAQRVDRPSSGGRKPCAKHEVKGSFDWLMTPAH